MCSFSSSPFLRRVASVRESAPKSVATGDGYVIEKALQLCGGGHRHRSGGCRGTGGGSSAGDLQRLTWLHVGPLHLPCLRLTAATAASCAGDCCSSHDLLHDGGSDELVVDAHLRSSALPNGMPCHEARCHAHAIAAARRCTCTCALHKPQKHLSSFAWMRSQAFWSTRRRCSSPACLLPRSRSVRPPLERR